jgi:hypothetical protein
LVVHAGDIRDDDATAAGVGRDGLGFRLSCGVALPGSPLRVALGLARLALSRTGLPLGGLQLPGRFGLPLLGFALELLDALLERPCVAAARRGGRLLII